MLASNILENIMISRKSNLILIYKFMCICIYACIYYFLVLHENFNIKYLLDKYLELFEIWAVISIVKKAAAYQKKFSLNKCIICILLHYLIRNCKKLCNKNKLNFRHLALFTSVILCTVMILNDIRKMFSISYRENIW